IAGTLDYMSPEQRSGGELDARSDLYACGVMFYELLTGERPAGTEVPSDSNKAVPKALDEVFRRSYARLDKRYASADEFAAALKALQAPAGPPPLPSREGPGAVAQSPTLKMPPAPDTTWQAPALPAGYRQSFVACPSCHHTVDAADQFC